MSKHDDFAGTLRNGVVTGTIGAVATAAVIAAFGQAKTGSPWTPFNAISQMLFGDKAIEKNGFAPKETLTGIALNGLALGGWGVLYEFIVGRRQKQEQLPTALAQGAAASGIVYLLDYHIFPPKLRPNFEKRTGNLSVAIAYAALALVFGLSPLWKQKNKKTGGTR